jgi:hypothetical protein
MGPQHPPVIAVSVYFLHHYAVAAIDVTVCRGIGFGSLLKGILEAETYRGEGGGVAQSIHFLERCRIKIKLKIR